MTPAATHGAMLMRTAALFLIATAACAPAHPPAAPAPEQDFRVLGREVHWVRTSAEYRALSEQVYTSAAERLEALAAGREPGTWAVIMDADETILDNSEFQRRLIEAGEEFEESAWDAWVLEEAAEAVPGSVEFTHLVHRLGGRVAVVTNRHEGICPPTRRNLEALGARADVVLCETDTSQKEPRFRMVREGTTPASLPPLDVVLWIGDNIRDFPDLDQDLRAAPREALEAFGRTYFLLPNPQYGSWLGNPWR